MSKATDQMNELLLEITERDKHLLRLFIKEVCHCSDKDIFTFKKGDYELFITVHTTKDVS